MARRDIFEGHSIGESGWPGLKDQRGFDLIKLRLRTAGMASKPGRVATFASLNFLPHHDPTI
jgi:hypothetical protein